MITILDEVHEQICTDIAMHPPERGGALYGPPGTQMITHFEHDAHARTTAASYIPSSQLIENVARVERETGLELKAIIHSHPMGATRPSAGDERTMAKFFQMNPHIGRLLLPIVQPIAHAHDGGYHEFIHWYRVERCATDQAQHGYSPSRKRPIAVLPLDCAALPLTKHMEQLLAALGCHGIVMQRSDGLMYLNMSGAWLAGLKAASIAGHELMFFVACGYPSLAPLVLVRGPGEDTVCVRVRWEGLNDVQGSLDGLVEEILALWRDKRRDAGPVGTQGAFSAIATSPPLDWQPNAPGLCVLPLFVPPLLTQLHEERGFELHGPIAPCVGEPAHSTLETSSETVAISFTNSKKE